MNYEILLESFAAGEGTNKDELILLELELSSQLESIKFSRTHQGCIEKAPKHICEAAQVYEGRTCTPALIQYSIRQIPFLLGRTLEEQKSLMHFKRTSI
tara:strand:- start:142 stop:438 length:297 start_codon:yes stop_codon:yes gene_type:complete